MRFGEFKLSSFTEEERTELYEMDSSLCWFFEPTEFANRLKADPDTVVKICNMTHKSLSEIAVFNRIGQNLGRS